MTTPNHPANDTSIDELAALYALELHDDDDKAAIEEAFAQDESFVERISDVQSVVDDLAYSIPLVPMASDVKQRVFDRIAQEPAPPESPLMELLKRSIAELKQQASQLEWNPLPGVKSLEIAIWQTDEENREVAFFARKPSGGLFPNHAHASGEVVLVLEGDFIANGQVYGVGETANAIANTAHQPGTTNGTLIFCISSMDDEILGA